jgi:SAM-dependent methyltransferase
VPFLRERRCRPEIMDEPGLDPARHHLALQGLARINFWSGSARILWPPLANLGRRLGRSVRVLDLATGAGDVPIRLWLKARRAGLPLEIEGRDVSPVAVDHARARSVQVGAEVRFAVLDVLAEPLPAGFDAVTSSLFLHHLTPDQACDLLGKMAAATGRLVLVNDLSRSLTGLILAHLGTRLLSTSHVVHVDGPRSVAAAFTPAEARALAERAGLHGATVVRRWPCRWLLSWERP